MRDENTVKRGLFPSNGVVYDSRNEIVLNVEKN
jgi:hypothetical protein